MIHRRPKWKPERPIPPAKRPTSGIIARLKIYVQIANDDDRPDLWCWSELDFPGKHPVRLFGRQHADA